ncbi:DUF7313 family protein [Halomicrobium salinisoli]|uniref:DUF7313 family protein n=1 Tax=Halomicrobium salinisoli TaxID=2878391 RepID=UPI001CF039DE|nr:hypothetical protein [Halomicrobium salinisoli]
MQAFVNLFGPLDALLAPEVFGGVRVIEYVLLALVVANFVTRKLAHDNHVLQYREGGAEAVSRYLPHEAMNVLLVLGSFYYTTVEQHGGIVLSTLVMGLFLTDFFEFESRKVEARREIDMERPKASLVAAILVLMYAGFQSLFWLVQGYWSAVV